MGQSKPACQTPQERLSNNREVSLGFAKKISSDEARRCPQCAEPTCLQGCPLGVDIPGFIRLLRESDAVSALEKIKKDNPFPAICGRICPAPCESACIFYEEGAPIAIRALERYASDFGKSKIGVGLRPTGNPRHEGKPILTDKVKEIAIVGSGPSAMSAASFLLRQGFKVEMFEAADEPGGFLRYGIPEFRLPQEVLNSQFEELRGMGLELHTNILIGRMRSLEELARTFDAVILATGASLPNFASIEGENLAGVYYAEEFLARLQVLSKEHVLPSAINLLRGTETVVIGSGYAALDAARVSLRLGQQVHIIFAGLEEEMGISADELKEALEEGLKIQAPFEPLRMIADSQGIVQSVECQRLEIIEGKGQLSLEPAIEESVVLAAQTVILANGQKPNPFLSNVTKQLKVNPDNTFLKDEKSSKTSLEKVFVTASAANGPMSVVEAFADGKKIAKQIMEILK